MFSFNHNSKITTGYTLNFVQLTSKLLVVIGCNSLNKFTEIILHENSN